MYAELLPTCLETEHRIEHRGKEVEHIDEDLELLSLPRRTDQLVAEAQFIEIAHPAHGRELAGVESPTVEAGAAQCDRSREFMAGVFGGDREGGVDL